MEEESADEYREILAHEKYGDIKLAIEVHKSAIERRTRVHGENSLKVARSFQDLGEMHFNQEGRLDEAEEALKRALQIRAALATLPRDDEDDSAHDVRRDAARSRDMLGRVYERRGDIEAARSVRRAGLELSQVICGNSRVTTRPQIPSP